MISPLLLATSNAGKVAEIRAALAGTGIELVAAADWGAIPEPEESGDTFAENARLKAFHYWRFTGLSALADDSGLEVAALHGRPGVHSSRYAASDPERIQRLLRELSDLDPGRDWEKRAARFVCTLCLVGSEGLLLEVEGEVRGLIATESRGHRGFGYDPVFFYPPLGKTFGELDRATKNRVSHRAAALRKLRDKLVLLSL